MNSIALIFSLYCFLLRQNDYLKYKQKSSLFCNSALGQSTSDAISLNMVQCLTLHKHFLSTTLFSQFDSRQYTYQSALTSALTPTNIPLTDHTSSMYVSTFLVFGPPTCLTLNKLSLRKCAQHGYVSRQPASHKAS